MHPVRFPTRCPGAQRGQATTELLAAMALIIPLFFGIIYIGKYSDIKHQAIQASRYAALERAMNPAAPETDAIIQKETVARFFRDGGNKTFQVLHRADEATGATAANANPNWKQANGQQLLGQFADVSVALGANKQVSLQSSYTPLTNVAARTLFDNLPADGAIQADVEVPIANVAHAAALANLNIKVAATTVIAGNAWNANGAKGVADHFAKSPLSAVPARGASWLSKIPGINLLFKWTAGTEAPHFGCIKPEIVPDDVAKKGKYDPSKTTGDNACL